MFSFLYGFLLFFFFPLIYFFCLSVFAVSTLFYWLSLVSNFNLVFLLFLWFSSSFFVELSNFNVFYFCHFV